MEEHYRVLLGLAPGVGSRVCPYAVKDKYVKSIIRPCHQAVARGEETFAECARNLQKMLTREFELGKQRKYLEHVHDVLVCHKHKRYLDRNRIVKASQRSLWEIGPWEEQGLPKVSSLKTVKYPL